MESTHAGGEAGTVWIRTPPIRDARGLAAFQQTFAERLSGLRVEPLYDRPLATQGSVTQLGRVGISIAETTPTRCIHPRACGDDDAVLLTHFMRGQWEVQARSRHFDLADGDAILSLHGQIDEQVAHTAASLCGLTLSRSMLTSMAVDVDALLLRPLRGQPAAALLVQYAHLLRGPGVLASAGLARAAAVHLHDLAALVAGASGDAAHHALGRGGRAARLLAARHDIAAHFTDPRYSVNASARRLGVTPRYLQMLLEQDGQTFTARVLEQRLALAHRLLADPRLRARAISAIALDVGFGDLSHFNRCFRRRFGMTPSDARAAAGRAPMAAGDGHA